MTRTLCPKGFVLAALLTISCPNLFALDQVAYAKSLEAERDWYRAISQWKEVRFEATDATTFWTASQAIVLDLWRANQFEAGLTELALLEARPEGRSGNRARALLAWSGLFQYQLSRFPAAEFSFTRADDKKYLGLLLASTGRLEAARQMWTGLELPDPLSFPVDTRSPLLALSLSALVPGSGQAYAGHWFDGLQAFSFVGLFGLANYGAYLYESKNSSNYLFTGLIGVATAAFYAANLYGAAKTADYYNQNQVNSRTSALAKLVFATELPDLGQE